MSMGWRHFKLASAADNQAVYYREIGRGDAAWHGVRREELLDEAGALAVRMCEAGWRGRRVVLNLPNGLNFVICAAAALMAGVVAVPVAPARSRPQATRLADIVRDTEACAILLDDEMVPALVEEVAPRRAVTLGQLRDGAAARPGQRAEPASDMAFVQYTAGATCEPRGVEIPIESLIANLDMMARRLRLGCEDSGLSWLPMVHDFGLVGAIYLPLRYGYAHSYMDPFMFMQRPLRWIEAMSRTRATISGGPNFAFQAVTERVDPAEIAALDLSAWRVAPNAAEPIRAEVLQRFCALLAPAGFSGNAVMPCYGLTEATLFVTGAPAGLGYRVRDAEAGRAAPAPVSSGRVMPEAPVAILDPDGAIRPEGATGEIAVGGASLFAGYLGAPGETAAATVDLGGARFLRTGDAGFVEGGELYVLGRCDEVIEIEGRCPIYPTEIEAVVAGVAANGRPNNVVAFDAGQEGVVVIAEMARPVVCAREIAAQEAEIRDAMSETLGVVPARILFFKPHTLPKTACGKPRRAACKALYASPALSVNLCMVKG